MNEEVINESAGVETEPQGTDQISETPETLDYKVDKRFGKMWKNENDIYKSYRELEKKYPETQKQLKQYQETLKKYGVDDLSKLEEVGNQYKYYSDPESDLNKFLNYLSPVLSDEKRLEQFRDYVSKQIKDMEIEKFGSHLSDSERLALKEAQEVKEQFKQLQEKQEIAEITKQIEGNVSEIEKYAESQNLEFDKNAFLEECKVKGVPTSLMMDFFKSRAMEYFVKNASRKAEDNVIKNINKSKVGSIPTGNKSQPSNSKMSFNAQLESILNRQ